METETIKKEDSPVVAHYSFLEALKNNPHLVEMDNIYNGMNEWEIQEYEEVTGENK